ncbi:MAG: cell division protein ZapA [Pseudomonadales bacterium]|nr:cell division protein ZapA [Pseudomonadales bacterium]
MTEDIKTLAIDLLDKEYRVSCPPGEEDSLRRSARHLDDKMREIRLQGKTIGLERIAVMAALNMAHELIQSQDEVDRLTENSRDQLNRLMEKLDLALAQTS